MHAALQSPPFLTKMWESEERSNWPPFCEEFPGNFISSSYPWYVKNEIYSFCSPDTYSLSFFLPGWSDDSPFIVHEVLEAVLKVVLIECLVSIYVILLCTNVDGICSRVISLATGNCFSLRTLREKYIPAFNKPFLNCKKTSLAMDTIIYSYSA